MIPYTYQYLSKEKEKAHDLCAYNTGYSIESFSDVRMAQTDTYYAFVFDKILQNCVLVVWDVEGVGHQTTSM